MAEPRDLAVQIVDQVRGCTMEHWHDPREHERQYDHAEELIITLLAAERDRLKAINAELLAALEQFTSCCDGQLHADDRIVTAVSAARAALAKARGEP